MIYNLFLTCLDHPHSKFGCDSQGASHDRSAQTGTVASSQKETPRPAYDFSTASISHPSDKSSKDHWCSVLVQHTLFCRRRWMAPGKKHKTIYTFMFNNSSGSCHVSLKLISYDFSGLGTSIL